LAYTLTFLTKQVPEADVVAEWLTQQGEPFERAGPQALNLRALPIRFLVNPADDSMIGQIDVNPTVPLSRLVNLVFKLSMVAGADVKLAGHGEVTRADLWIRLADEQDRLRIVEAVTKAEQHGKREELLSRLWTILHSFFPERDVRWELGRGMVVEMLEVDDPAGISLDEARWHDAEATSGDVLPMPVQGYVHILAWRWLSAAYPALAEL